MSIKSFTSLEITGNYIDVPPLRESNRSIKSLVPVQISQISIKKRSSLPMVTKHTRPTLTLSHDNSQNLRRRSSNATSDILSAKESKKEQQIKNYEVFIYSRRLKIKNKNKFDKFIRKKFVD